MVSAPVRRQQIAYVCQRGRSLRRACALLSVARSAPGTSRGWRPVMRLPWLRCMSSRRSTRGTAIGASRCSWRVDGHVMSADRAHRLWRLHRLQVPRKRPRRRVATSRPRPLPAPAAGQVWAYDFVFDACANGQQLKCLTVVDEFTRECLAIDVAGSIRSGRVIEVLSRWSASTARRAICARTTAPSSSRGHAALATAGQHRYGTHRSRQAVAERRRTNRSTASSATSA